MKGLRPTTFAVICALTCAGAAVWIAAIVSGAGGPKTSQSVSNIGLTAMALLAGVACVHAAWRSQTHRRMWALLGASAFSWGIGQAIWTAYESILGREVPFPSLADVGYLGAVPLAAAALISLPTVSQSSAGRARTILDGLMIAGFFFLTSWVVVLKPVFQAGGDGLLAQGISLAYPAGDVVIATIVVYVLLRVRQTRAATAVPLGLIGFGLAALAVADSGFAYLTATEAYSSGSLIDIGWFLAFMAIALAGARGSKVTDERDAHAAEGRPLPLLLPYAAVTIALAVSSIEVLRSGAGDPVMSWIRTGIILALVVRQILTLLENLSLTRHLHARLEDLRASEQRFEALVQHSSDVVTVIAADGTVEYQSESVQRVFGYAGESLVGKPITSILDEESAEKLSETLADAASEAYATRVLEVVVRHETGRVCVAEMTVTNLLENADVGGFVLNTRDISERRTLQEQLVHEAFHDSLTDLANRSLFSERVEEVLFTGGERQTRAAILFMDLDGFKAVNDSLGHASGDLLLVQFAERLRDCDTVDLVARLGGDEFAVLIDDEANERLAVSLAKRVTRSLRRPFVIDGHEIYLSASVGIAMAEPDAETADQLLRNADLAMYRAKSRGEGSYAMYDPKMHARLVERLQLESDLRRALEMGELVLHYQPTIALDTGAIRGVEALVRWNHPARGLLAPDVFIPLAEETGLIRPLGRWVLDEACRQASHWRERFGMPAFSVSVNISGRQLRHRELAKDVQNALDNSGLPPDCLVLEITESVLMDHSEENLGLLGELKTMGIRLAIDDFGTGYSSLSYLHRFPIDILKVDRSFIERLTGAPGDSEVVGTIAQLGQSLRMETVAEGVELPEQVTILRALGYDLAQGYHFSRPVEPAKLAELLGPRGLGPSVLRDLGREAA